MELRIVNVRGHYEVYYNDKFICSGDTWNEAVREAKKMLDEGR